MSSENPATDQIEYRPATELDQPTIDWYNTVASFGARQDFEVDRTVVDRLMRLTRAAAFSEGFGRPGDVGYIATQGQQPVGAVWGRLYERSVDDPLADYPFEITLGVAKDQRGKGIGRVLLDKIIEGAEQAGVLYVALGVSIHNPTAQRLYERSGWNQIDPDHGLVNGEYIMMVKRAKTQ